MQKKQKRKKNHAEMHTIELIIFFKTVLFSLDWNVESHIISRKSSTSVNSFESIMKEDLCNR